MEKPSVSAESRSFKNFSTRLQSTSYSTVLLATTVVDIMLNDVRYSARALIDPASHATFVSRRLQRKLDLPTFSVPSAAIFGLNGAIAANSTRVCSVSLGSPIDPEFHLQTDAYVVEQLTAH